MKEKCNKVFFAAIRMKTEMLQIMVKQIKKSLWGKSQYEEGNCGRKRPL